MFGIGPLELVVILVVALLVFGPKRVPELARTVGRGLAEFRRASNDLRQTLALDELQKDLRRDLDGKQTIHRPDDRPAQAGGDATPSTDSPTPKSPAAAATESTEESPTSKAQSATSPGEKTADDDRDGVDRPDDLAHHDAGALDEPDSKSETNSNSAADSELGNIPVSDPSSKRG